MSARLHGFYKHIDKHTKKVMTKKINYQFMITLFLSRFVLIGALTFGSDRDKNAEGLIAIKLVLCVVGGCGI